ncbi:hypothetical protein AVEN_97284-1 [Araneus ventricosus]|uniref:Uncharacterized protein n=1 Tax=Araneus ventricosus TaxID=182803 RepID=A0A4Y2T3Y4_ARAVE|nr:hypothetical protein AVEN_97284-1 [Araneus ventricosus]
MVFSKLYTETHSPPPTQKSLLFCLSSCGGPGVEWAKYVWSFLLAGSPKLEGHSITQLKYKGSGQSQTSSLGRPRSSANRRCTLLLYHESFAYSFSVSDRTLELGLAED